eukprot:IDg6849t1
MYSGSVGVLVTFLRAEREGDAEVSHQHTYSYTAYPLEKTNITNITTLTMEDPARRDAQKLATGEIVDIFGGTWEGPEAWSSMEITKADRVANFVEYFPVWRYPEGLDYPQAKSIDNSLSHPPISGNLAEAPNMERGATVKASRVQKRRMSIDVDEFPAAQRSHVEDGAHIDKPTTKKANEAPAANISGSRAAFIRILNASSFSVSRSRNLVPGLI